MIPNLKWMIGLSIVAVEKKDYTWFFRLNDGAVIAATDSPWRLVTPKGVAITSEDHGHQFGLPSPVDAAEIVKPQALGRRIDNCEVDKKTGTSSSTWDQFLLRSYVFSSGYEAWHLTHSSLEIVCTGGGKIVNINEMK